MEKRKALLSAILLFMLLLLIIGVFLSCNGKKMSDKENVTAKKQYVCSMHPQVVQNVPGDCPICGMFLIEKVVDKNPADASLKVVVLPVNKSVLSTITTINPVQDNLPLVIEASGIINFDTRKTRMISARFAGIIEKSYVKSQFQRIKKGQKIFRIYCPDIYSEHWNYIQILQMYPKQDNLTVEAREWLQFLGLTVSQIESIKTSVKPNYHLDVYSDAEGYAVPAGFDTENYFAKGNNDINSQTGRNGIGLNEGLNVETGTPLFKVVDLKSLRADLKVKTQDIGRIKRGQKVFFSLDTSTGKKQEATVSQIEPLNGGVFQLVKIYFTDRDGIMIPGRQIQARIMTGKHTSIWLPETTILNMGQHKSVFVKKENNFLATIIKTGIHSGNKIEIISGLDLNSKVALNASLLIDSDGLIK